MNKQAQALFFPEQHSISVEGVGGGDKKGCYQNEKFWKTKWEVFNPKIDQDKLSDSEGLPQNVQNFQEILLVTLQFSNIHVYNVKSGKLSTQLLEKFQKKERLSST